MTKKYMIIISCVIGLLYAVLVPFARNGYGYMGYFGYMNPPSFWYFGDAQYYANKDLKQGSRSGTRVRGGGPGRGK